MRDPFRGEDLGEVRLERGAEDRSFLDRNPDQLDQRIQGLSVAHGDVLCQVVHVVGHELVQLLVRSKGFVCPPTLEPTEILSHLSSLQELMTGSESS